MANDYNRLPRPAVVAVRDGDGRLLLRRETERRPVAPGGNAVSGGPARKPIRVALLGCGTVGSQVVRLLTEQADDLAAARRRAGRAGRHRRAPAEQAPRTARRSC